MAAITGKPRPRLTPRIILFDTPLVVPYTKVRTLDSVVLVGGTYDVGLPDVAGKFRASAPNATVVETELRACVDSAAAELEARGTTSVTVDVALSVVCSEPGQLISPGD